MTYKELFENLKKGAKWDIGVSINRTNPLPLDQYSIFESLEALQTYAASNAVAYPGQIVAVLATGGTEEEPTYTAEAYIIKSVGAGANVMKLAATTASGDVAQDISDLQRRVKALEDEMPNKLNKNNPITASGDKYHLVKYDEKGLVIAGRTLEDSDVPGLAQVKTDINTLKEQVTGGVHWIGQANVDFGADNFPGIAEYTPEAGDIVARNGIEYIYNGSVWQEFGNEGAHLTLDQVNEAIVGKLGNLDFGPLELAADETIALIKQKDGLITATKQKIAIDISGQLAGKQDVDPDLTKIIAASKGEAKGFLNRAVGENGEATYVYKEALSEAEVKKVKVDNASNADEATHAGSATKVDNDLIITVGDAEPKRYNGSAEVSVTIPKLSAATSEELGGIKIGFQKNGQQVPVELDENNKAYVTLDEKPGVIEDGGLEKVGNNFGIAAGGVTTNKIAAGAVTNEKITSMEANKLTQAAGDYLILNCGDSTATFTVDQTKY